MQRQKRQGKRKRKASILSVIGTILLVAVILLCLPLTLPRIFGLAVYSVVSGSMEPAIPVGSLVYVKEVEAAEVEEGEIIAFYSASDSGAVITHRVVQNQIVSGRFITKGDANEAEDAVPIDYDLLLGKVILSVPFLGTLLSIFVTPAGKIVAACAILLGLLLNIKAGKENVLLFFVVVSAAVFLGGCAKNGQGVSGKTDDGTGEKSIRDATPYVLVPEASGTVTYEEGNVFVDASNTSEGYVMMKYTGINEKVKFQVKTPDETEYTYLVTKQGEYIAYPLSGGSGSYQLTLLESVSAEDDLYAVVFTRGIEAAVKDEFSPFLYANHYVDFNADSAAVAKGKELAEDCTSDIEVVSNIYNYVITNISYDTKKAEEVAYGYTPDVDETLASGKGICFDYAALMSAMLRSQRIPTKLEVGYVGELYHAWISCYVDEIGWVDNIIEFDGKSWSLMDPTFAAGNDSDEVKEYIGDGSRYMVKYTY